MEQNETRTLWISIGAAIFAVVLLYGWAQDKRAGYARKFGQTRTVVVAREDIREYEIVDASKLEVIEQPSDFIQPSAMQDPSEIVGQIALAPIRKGEQILNTKLVFPDKSTGLSMQVSPGKRAVSLPVNKTNAVSKLIKPGDRVDILAAIDDGSGVNKVRKIRTILQDVTVLATGQSIVDNLPIQIVKGSEDNYEIRNLRVDNDYSTITVEVSPSNAQLLMHLASIPMPMFFSLRNPNDRIKIPLKTVDINDVLKRIKRRKPSSKKPKAKLKKIAPKAKPQKKRGRFENI